MMAKGLLPHAYNIPPKIFLLATLTNLASFISSMGGGRRGGGAKTGLIDQ